MWFYTTASSKPCSRAVANPTDWTRPTFIPSAPTIFQEHGPRAFLRTPRWMSTGEFVFFNYSFNTKPYMEYGVVGPDNKLICSTEIDLPGPRLPHDSWITENYTILHDLPMFWDPELLRQGRKKMVFDQSMKTRFGVDSPLRLEMRWSA